MTKSLHPVRWVMLMVVVLTLTTTVAAQQVTLTFVHEAPENHMKGRGANLVAELAHKYSNGQIRINVFPAAQLVSTLEEVPAAVRGEVDIIAPYFNYLTAIDPVFDILFVPLLFDDNEEAIAFMDSDLAARMLDRLERRGLKGLGMWYEAPTNIWVTADPPITSVETIAGRKIRAFATAPLEAGLKQLGAHPVLLAPADVYLALQQGLVEGVVSAPPFVYANGWHEILKHGTKVPITVGGYVVAVSQRTWNRLSSEHRAIIERAVREATEWNRSVVRQELEQAYVDLAAAGVQLWELSDKEIARWREIVQPVYNALHPELRELVRQVQEARGK